MTRDDETVTINKKALIAAFMEMEKEYSRDDFYLFKCLEHLEQAYLDLRRLEESRFCATLSVITRLLFPNPDDLDLADEVLEAWDAEFETQYAQDKKEEAQGSRQVLIFP